MDSSDIILKLNATALIDALSFSTLQFSAEKKISNDFSIAGEFGYRIYDIKNADTSFIKPSGYKGNIELRYYNVLQLVKKDARYRTNQTGLYIGLNFFYRQHKYDTEIIYYKETDSLNHLVDDLTVYKKNWGINGIMGCQLAVRNKIFFDGYAGIGIMRREIENYNREYNPVEGDFLQNCRHCFFGNPDEMEFRENSGIKPNVTLGIRVGYRIK